MTTNYSKYFTHLDSKAKTTDSFQRMANNIMLMHNLNLKSHIPEGIM